MTARQPFSFQWSTSSSRWSACLNRFGGWLGNSFLGFLVSGLSKDFDFLCCLLVLLLCLFLVLFGCDFGSLASCEQDFSIGFFWWHLKFVRILPLFIFLKFGLAHLRGLSSFFGCSFIVSLFAKEWSQGHLAFRHWLDHLLLLRRLQSLAWHVLLHRSGSRLFFVDWFQGLYRYLLTCLAHVSLVSSYLLGHSRNLEVVDDLDLFQYIIFSLTHLLRTIKHKKSSLFKVMLNHCLLWRTLLGAELLLLAGVVDFVKDIILRKTLVPCVLLGRGHRSYSLLLSLPLYSWSHLRLTSIRRGLSSTWSWSQIFSLIYEVLHVFLVVGCHANNIDVLFHLFGWNLDFSFLGIYFCGRLCGCLLASTSFLALRDIQIDPVLVKLLLEFVLDLLILNSAIWVAEDLVRVKCLYHF